MAHYDAGRWGHPRHQQSLLECQSRALKRVYPIVTFDALRVKIRDAESRMVKNKAVYVALSFSRGGLREVSDLWFADNEGAKFWL